MSYKCADELEVLSIGCETALLVVRDAGEQTRCFVLKIDGSGDKMYLSSLNYDVPATSIRNKEDITRLVPQVRESFSSSNRFQHP
jgi:hypothetical protein